VRHFDLTRWLDYLRGFVPLTEMAAMEEHLGGDCGTCWRTVELLLKLDQVTRREREYRVPAESVRIAKAAFALAGSREPTGVLSTVMARLVFDSFATSVPVGVRARRGAERHQRRVLYEAGGHCVDVSLQQVPDSPQVTLVGQVTCRQTPDQPLAGLVVELVSTEGKVASTVSNPQGEFCLDYLSRPNTLLCVYVNEQSCVAIALSGLEPASCRA